MVPPLGITFSLVLSKLLNKNIYTAQEKENIKVAFPMGLCMISEGVIPIAMNDIIRTVICTATGCGVTGAISFSLDVGSKVPSGGVFVIPAMSNPIAALIALLAGTAVTGVLLVPIKKKGKQKKMSQMVDEKEEDLDLSGFTISQDCATDVMYVSMKGMLNVPMKVTTQSWQSTVLTLRQRERRSMKDVFKLIDHHQYRTEHMVNHCDSNLIALIVKNWHKRASVEVALNFPTMGKKSDC